MIDVQDLPGIMFQLVYLSMTMGTISQDDEILPKLFAELPQGPAGKRTRIVSPPPSPGPLSTPLLRYFSTSSHGNAGR